MISIRRVYAIPFLLISVMAVLSPVNASEQTRPDGLTTGSSAKPRARDLGIRPGVLLPGPLNAITDVAGVRVGHVTLKQGAAVNTGVTVVLPHGGNLYQDKVPAGFAVGNGFGKFAGSTQIRELGEIETPIVLTNTLSVAEGMRGVIEYTLSQPNDQVSPLFEASMEASEEAIYNALVAGVTTEGFEGTIKALPLDKLTEIIQKFHRETVSPD